MSILSKDAVAALRCGDPLNFQSERDQIEALCDSHEALRAEVERAASINAELRRDLTSSRDNGSNMAVEIGVLRARAEAAEAELARLRQECVDGNCTGAEREQAKRYAAEGHIARLRPVVDRACDVVAHEAQANDVHRQCNPGTCVLCGLAVALRAAEGGVE